MPVVTTSLGDLSGLDLEGVSAFLGIRYAQPPVGPLRFQAPVPAPAWDGVVAADRFGPSAPQPTGGPFSGLVPGMGVADQSEDCLTLNVWAPTGAADLPVLVWLHGGAFTLGGSSLPTYDGSLLAREQQVVVVSLNYRLGALGWLTGVPGVQPNCGLLDQVLALQWVRDHVSGFGGDPGAVTVFGESAGAGSVLSLLATPSAKGLFHRAIAQSPGAGQTLPREVAATVGQALLAEVGLEADVVDLLAAQQRVADALLMTVGAMAFHPAVDGDVLEHAPLQDSGSVPLLAGCTTEEMRLFADPVLSAFDTATLVSVLEPLMSAEAHRPLGAAAVEAVVAAYPGDGRDVFAQVATDVVMRLPLHDLLDRHQGPVHAYSFSWQAGDHGACHAADLPFTFGTLDREGWSDWVGGPEQDAARLSRAIRDCWGSFARTGTPTSDLLPDWPEYDEARQVMELGRTTGVLTDPLAEARVRCAPVREPVP